MKLDRLVGVLFFLLALSYPVLVYFGLKKHSAKTVGLILAGLLLVRFIWGRSREKKRRVGLMLLPPFALCVTSALVDNRMFVLYLPVLVSIALLFSFGITLFRGPSAVETLARLQHPELTVEEVAHCRLTTQVWVGFFILNGAIAFWTAWWGSLDAWGLYNGLLTYIAMGILFAVEFVYRHWRFRRYTGLPTDPLFRRIFPPRS
jgi:uncharacterized membrane protein